MNGYELAGRVVSILKNYNLYYYFIILMIIYIKYFTLFKKIYITY